MNDVRSTIPIMSTVQRREVAGGKGRSRLVFFPAGLEGLTVSIWKLRLRSVEPGVIPLHGRCPPASIDRLSPSRRPRTTRRGLPDVAKLALPPLADFAGGSRAAIPDWLTVDTFDGSALDWSGLFSMSGVRPWWSPPVLGVSSFPETNVRTYVHLAGSDPGVWFISLDAGGSVGGPDRPIEMGPSLSPLEDARATLGESDRLRMRAAVARQNGGWRPRRRRNRRPFQRAES